MDGDASDVECGADAPGRRSAKARTALARATARLARARLLGLSCWIACTACAGTGTERNLAPLFNELSTAGGGTEIEALGGALRVRRTRPNGPLRQWAIRPLVISDRLPDGDSITRFLTPFGFSQTAGGDYTWQLLPITRYHERVYENGESEWQLLTLPGIYWSRQPDGRIARAWFPFGGVMEHFLSFDKLVFVLFPIYMRTEQHGRTTYNFLFPLFSVTSGDSPEERDKRGETDRHITEEGSGFRIWPLYGRERVENSHEHSFVMWPLFHWQHNELTNPPDKQEFKWLFLPVVGRTTRGSYASTSVLWPFFGYGHDPQTGFWAWDGPWPILRLYDDPVDDAHRVRVWPLYSSYQGDGLDSQWYLWPMVNVRHEDYERAYLDGLYIIPFWRSWRRTDVEAGVSSFQKLWPLYQVERTDEYVQRTVFPALNPLWRTPEIDEMYAWMWELYTRDRDHDLLHERSWLGLYRREKDSHEDRISFGGIWASRRYYAGGEPVRETSLLFGLLRWRSRGSNSLGWLWPAAPGPGWPLERTTETESTSD
jgi:hypothetical protein